MSETSNLPTRPSRSPLLLPIREETVEDLFGHDEDAEERHLSVSDALRDAFDGFGHRTSLNATEIMTLKQRLWSLFASFERRVSMTMDMWNVAAARSMRDRVETDRELDQLRDAWADACRDYEVWKREKALWLAEREEARLNASGLSEKLAYYRCRVETLEAQFEALEGGLFDAVHAVLAEREYICGCGGLKTAPGTDEVASLRAEVVAFNVRIEKMKVGYNNALLNRLRSCQDCPRCSDPVDRPGFI